MSFFKGVFRSGNFTKSRLDAYSDGVFAIVVTLLVLELHVPELTGGEHLSHELQEGMFHLLPKFFSYILSFGYISIYWVNHHQLFHLIKRADRGIFWFNSFFLLCLTFIPFPTALVGSYPHEPLAVIFYGVTMMVTAISFVSMKWYAVNYAKLVDPNLEKNVFEESLFKVVAGPALYLLAIAAAALMDTRIALFIYVIIPIIYFFPGQLEKKI